jgi:hypothetical protein
MPKKVQNKPNLPTTPAWEGITITDNHLITRAGVIFSP